MKYRLLLALVLLAAAGGSSVTLHNSHVTFKEALQRCSEVQALGSVTFALNHARIGTAPGVSIDESPPGEVAMIEAELRSENGDKSAKVTIDQAHRTVAAKNVRVKRNGFVACILPD